MTHRFFLPPEAFRGDGLPASVVLDGPIAHQLRAVLRLRPGARVVVLDDSGWEYEVELVELRSSGALARVCERREAPNEPRLSLVMYQAMLKGQHFEWVLQKGTELGVSAFVPVETGRSVARSTERWKNKRARLERIIREAAEQSGRGRLPRLADPISFAEACMQAAACERAYIPTVLDPVATPSPCRAGTEPGHRDAPPTDESDYAVAAASPCRAGTEPGHRDAPATEEDDRASPTDEGAKRIGLVGALRALDVPPQRIALLIGPEGGFDAQEVDLARRHGIRAVTLGPRILRAETAAIAAAAIVLAELGEMG